MTHMKRNDTLLAIIKFHSLTFILIFTSSASNYVLGFQYHTATSFGNYIPIRQNGHGAFFLDSILECKPIQYKNIQYNGSNKGRYLMWRNMLGNDNDHPASRPLPRNRNGGNPYSNLKYNKLTDIQLPLLILEPDSSTSSANVMTSVNNGNNDDKDSDGNKKDDQIILPLPSAHLPVELSTLNIYGVNLVSASQKRMMEEAKVTPIVKPTGEAMRQPMQVSKGLYGHIIPTLNDNKKKKDDSDDDTGLVGSIGCAVEVIASGSPKISDGINDTDNAPVAVLTRGAFRFVVKEIISTFPYPVAIVDEFVDDDILDQSLNPLNDERIQNEGSIMDDDDEYEDEYEYEDEDDEEEDDDYDDYSDMYESIPTSEITSRTLQAMKSYINILLTQTKSNTPKTPLEQMILENAGISTTDLQAQQATAEEMAALFQVLTQELFEMNSPSRRRYAIAFIAAEIAALSNDLRTKILFMTDSVQRLKLILSVLESKISMERAKQMAQQLSNGADSLLSGPSFSSTDNEGDSGSIDDNGSADSNDGDRGDLLDNSLSGGKDLKVGTPTLPKWADQIRPGTRVEYFWNEEYGWCPGVVEDVFKVLDEVIVTVRFDDDEVHKLPITPEDKVRWRSP